MEKSGKGGRGHFLVTAPKRGREEEKEVYLCILRGTTGDLNGNKGDTWQSSQLEVLLATVVLFLLYCY